MCDPQYMRDVCVLRRIDDEARQKTPHVFEQCRAFATIDFLDLSLGRGAAPSLRSTACSTVSVAPPGSHSGASFASFASLAPAVSSKANLKRRVPSCRSG